MNKPNRLFVKTSLSLLSLFLVLANGFPGQSPAVPEAAPLLVFEALPSRQLLTRGEAVVLVLYLRNLSEQPIFVSRLQGDELVNFDVTGPDGKEVPWRGSARTNSKEAAPSNFVVLDKYQEISVKRTISLKDGAGFIFDKPGQYSVTGEYSLGPSERLAPFAAGTKIPTGTFRSAKAAFCIEACVLVSVAGQNGAMLSELSQPHTNAPQPRSTRCVSSTPTSLDTGRLGSRGDAQGRPSGH